MSSLIRLRPLGKTFTTCSFSCSIRRFRPSVGADMHHIRRIESNHDPDLRVFSGRAPVRPRKMGDTMVLFGSGFDLQRELSPIRAGAPHHEGVFPGREALKV